MGMGLSHRTARGHALLPVPGPPAGSAFSALLTRRDCKAEAAAQMAEERGTSSALSGDHPASASTASMPPIAADIPLTPPPHRYLQLSQYERRRRSNVFGFLT